MALFLSLFSVLLLAVTGGDARSLETSLVTYPENLRNPASRIVSGWPALPGQFPHQLSLRMVNSTGAVYACGGSIITSGWGITAAHCTAGRETIVVRAGTVNLTTPVYMFETTKYYNHPLFNEALATIVQRNDIGLIEFGIILTFSELVKPIRLQRSADKDRNYGGNLVTASGWGSIWTGGVSTENLNWVYLVGTANHFCWEQFGGSTIIVSSTICAVYYNITSQSACQGDSGGPLSYVDDDSEITMIGIASFVSNRGCHVGMPAAFIRPGHYHSWITQVTGVDLDWGKVVSPIDPPATTTTTARPGGNQPPLYKRTHLVTICLILCLLFFHDQV